MSDMLVKLYDLPESRLSPSGPLPPDITVRKPLGSEKSLIVQWVSENFGEHWASETDMSFSRSPVSCYIAQQGRELIGFACYDAAALGYFGPIGVVAGTPNSLLNSISRTAILNSRWGRDHKRD